MKPVQMQIAQVSYNVHTTRQYTLNISRHQTYIDDKTYLTR